MTHHSDKLTDKTNGMYACCASNRFGQTCHQGWLLKLSNYGPVNTSRNIPEKLHILDGQNYTMSCPLEGISLDYQVLSFDTSELLVAPSLYNTPRSGTLLTSHYSPLLA